MLKGFIFDLDGVVTDSAKYHLAAWGGVGKTIRDYPASYGK